MTQVLRRLAMFPALPALLAALLLSACASVGPHTIPRDRFDYSTAIADSWERQMLLNIIRMRYGESPIFMDVASVINQYELMGQVNASASLKGGLLANDVYSFGGNGRYTDRPTITYHPLTGKSFTQSLLTPIEPGRLISLTQAGYPVSFVFQVGLRGINGLHNQSSLGLTEETGDPDFFEVLKALGRIQKSRAVGVRLRVKEDGKQAVMFIKTGDEFKDVKQDIDYVREKLRLSPSEPEYALVFGLWPQNESEIAVLSRSMIEILYQLAADIDVPAPHLEDGRALRVTNPETHQRHMHIKSGSGIPDEAFVAVRHQGYWFWIDETDVISKLALTFMMILFSLAESGTEAQAPVLTIGAGF